ncbi:MAG: calcium-binding protein [Paracoccaceae bacterium]
MAGRYSGLLDTTKNVAIKVGIFTVTGQPSGTGDVFIVNASFGLGKLGSGDFEVRFGPQGRLFYTDFNVNGPIESLLSDLANKGLSVGNFDFSRDSVTFSVGNYQYTYNSAALNANFIDDFISRFGGSLDNALEVAEALEDAANAGLDMFSALGTFIVANNIDLGARKNPDFLAKFTNADSFIEDLKGSVSGTFETVARFGSDFVSLQFRSGEDELRGIVYERRSVDHQDAAFVAQFILDNPDISPILILVEFFGYEELPGYQSWFEIDGLFNDFFDQSFDPTFVPSDDIVEGTASADLIDITYVDADGDSIDDSGQTILAGNGNDLIYDGAGDDTVEGGAGRDQFHTGGGADLYDGGAGRDEVFYTTANEGLTIDTIDGTNGTGIAAGDTFVDIEILHGSEFNDVIISDLERTFGGNGDDTIYGSSGIDTLDGGAGMDELNGNDGADVLNGNGGADVLNGNKGADVLNGHGDADELYGGAGTDELNGGAGADVLNGGNDADMLNGGNGADVLNGGNGADMLNGGIGVDAIKGGAGNDVLTGGSGLDVFIFEDGFGKDTITDFSTFNQEDIDLSAVSQIVDFADLTANHMTQVGSDVVIDDGAGNTITIQGFGLSDLQAGDFLF